VSRNGDAESKRPQPTTKTNNNKIRTRFISVSINLTPTHYAKSTDHKHVIYWTNQSRTPTTGPPGKENGGGFKQMVELQEQILRKLE